MKIKELVSLLIQLDQELDILVDRGEHYEELQPEHVQVGTITHVYTRDPKNIYQAKEETESPFFNRDVLVF